MIYHSMDSPITTDLRRIITYSILNNSIYNFYLKHIVIEKMNHYDKDLGFFLNSQEKSTKNYSSIRIIPHRSNVKFKMMPSFVPDPHHYPEGFYGGLGLGYTFYYGVSPKSEVIPSIPIKITHISPGENLPMSIEGEPDNAFKLAAWYHADDFRYSGSYLGYVHSYVQFFNISQDKKYTFNITSRSPQIDKVIITINNA